MSLRGVIFDLDGVIVDTVPLHFKAWKKMFAEYGEEFSFDDYKHKVDGIPRNDGARAVLKHLPPKDLEAAATRKQNYFLELLEKQGVEVHKSAIDLAKEAKASSIKVAVISSSRNCRHILERAGLIDFFEVIIGGNDIERGKPNPDVFLEAAKRMDLSPDECLVVEDAVLGVRAAKRAEMKCIGIDHYQHPQRLKEADLVVSDLGGVLLDKIKELFK
jgi:beta-phosphoglucomutase